MKDLIIVLLTTYIVYGFDFWVDKEGFAIPLFIGIALIYYLFGLSTGLVTIGKERRNEEADKHNSSDNFNVSVFRRYSKSR